MKVKELIEKLQEFDENMEVMCAYDSYPYPTREYAEPDVEVKKLSIYGNFGYPNVPEGVEIEVVVIE